MMDIEKNLNGDQLLVLTVFLPIDWDRFHGRYIITVLHTTLRSCKALGMI